MQELEQFEIQLSIRQNAEATKYITTPTLLFDKFFLCDVAS